MELERPADIPDWIEAVMLANGCPLISVPPDISAWMHQHVEELPYEAFRWCQAQGLVRYEKVECVVTHEEQWRELDWDIDQGRTYARYALELFVDNETTGACLRGTKRLGLDTVTGRWMQTDYDDRGYGLSPTVWDYDREIDNSCGFAVRHGDDTVKYETVWLPGYDHNGVTLVYTLDQIATEIQAAVRDVDCGPSPIPGDASGGTCLRRTQYWLVDADLNVQTAAVHDMGRFPYRVPVDDTAADRWVVKYGCRAWFNTITDRHYPDAVSALRDIERQLLPGEALYQSEAAAELAALCVIHNKVKAHPLPAELQLVYSDFSDRVAAVALAADPGPVPREQIQLNRENLRLIALQGWGADMPGLLEELTRKQAAALDVYTAEQVRLLSLQRRQMSLVRQRRRLF